MNFRLPDRGSGVKRFSAMGLGMILVFLAFWYLWDARLSKPAAGGVADVSPEAFAQIASQGKPGILEFYTNSCPWCAKVEPELAKVKASYGEKVFVVKMNAEKYLSEASKHELTGVPTLLFFDAKGAPSVKVSGYRDFSGIVEVLKNLKWVD